MQDIAVNVVDLVKKYGDFTALANVSLDIRDNEFFTLLGPSGCGKTTLLRCIAGFEDVTEGAIKLYGEDIADLPPNKRPVNTVFQNYALFPHMDVTQNIMFGLLQLGQSNADAKKRTGKVLEMVQLMEFTNRLPSQLSGGQQQRVALARALAPNPKVLLLDEPLSALDLKLRQAVRLELQQLQRDTGITFVFVTHDQEEALTMSDRIAVIADGNVQQVGSAQDIYQAPVNKFVANFIGETNLIDVQVQDVTDDQGTCLLPGGASFSCPAASGTGKGVGHLSVRPERVGFAKPDKALLTGKVTRHVFLGTDMQVETLLDDGEIIVTRVQNSADSHIPDVGATIGLNFETSAARLLVD